MIYFVFMTTSLNEEEQMLVDTVRAFIDRDVKPTVNEVEHANEYPEAWIEQMKEMGIYGLAVPEEYDGLPISMPAYVQVTEELARGWMSLSGAMGGHTVVAKLLTMYGTEEQKSKYLPLMATGELRATMALTEPSGGSDLQAISTVARADGDDLVINGSKTWISNARRSGLIALLAKTDPNAEKLETVTFRDALKRGLKVVDSTAFSLCMDNKMPMRVFGMEPSGNITKAILGEKIGTLVTN